MNNLSWVSRCLCSILNHKWEKIVGNNGVYPNSIEKCARCGLNRKWVNSRNYATWRSYQSIVSRKDHDSIVPRKYVNRGGSWTKMN